MILQCGICKESFTLIGSPVKNLNFIPRACSDACFHKLLQKHRQYLTDPMTVYDMVEETMKMRSNYEKSLAQWLYQHKVPFAYEPFPLIVSTKPRQLYLPDFFLPCHNLFIEVKGRWERNGFAKFNRARAKLESSTFWLVDFPYLRRLGCKPNQME